METAARAQHTLNLDRLTPGPWFHSCDEGNQICNVNVAAGVIADLDSADYPTTPEGFACRERNARLIAAAPALFAACEALVDEDCILPVAVDMARTAIRQARGDA